MPILFVPFVPFLIAAARPDLPSRWARAFGSVFSSIACGVVTLGAALSGMSSAAAFPPIRGALLPRS